MFHSVDFCMSGGFFCATTTGQKPLQKVTLDELIMLVCLIYKFYLRLHNELSPIRLSHLPRAATLASVTVIAPQSLGRFTYIS